MKKINKYFNPHWYLRFRDLIGVYQIPNIRTAFNGNGFRIGITHLIWFFWFFHFIPESTAQNQSHISVDHLAQKWSFTGYQYYFYSEEPAVNEKNDFLFFKKDMTFQSRSQGILENGQWRLDKVGKRIYLSKKGEEGELVLIIDELSSEKLVVSIDDPDDSETKDIKIIYRSEKD